jgi:hypothetical protein
VEPDRFDNAVRSLFSTPSRRALVGLAVGVLLVPVVRDGDAAADKKGKNTHRHKEKRKNRRKKKHSDRCPKNATLCKNPDESTAGQLSGCCNTQTDGEGNPYEVCTDCGCCQYNQSTCCRGALYGLCCASGSQCSQSADFQNVACCSPDDKVCFGGCCDAEEECCMTTGPNPYPYCCAKGLTCKPSAGNTCVSK